LGLLDQEERRVRKDKKALALEVLQGSLEHLEDETLR
jgi:hypothetical protein